MGEKTVTVRNLTLGDGIPKICVPVTARSKGELKEQADEIRRLPFDLLELRADYYEGDPLQALHCLRGEFLDCPILYTFRTGEEGGEKDISLKEYIRLNRLAARSQAADLVDLELNRGEDLMRDLCPELRSEGVKTVLSFHDFSGTPGREELLGLFGQMQSLGADITKAAVMPHTDREILTLLEAAVAMKEGRADRPYIVMSMGKLGGITRLAGTLTGSAVTFASAGRASAPGQMGAAFVSEALSLL